MSAIASAAQLSRRKISVSVPGTDLVIVCRRPDLLGQVTRGVLPQPSVDAVLRQAQAGGVDPMASEDLTLAADFIDRWVCLAAVQPRIVLTEAEASESAVWVDDLDLALKLAIVSATTTKVAPVDPAVAEFRGDQSTGTAAPSDGTGVRDAPEPIVTH